MTLSYLSNTSYSLVSRSGVRNSALYHGFTVLLSNILFYSVLNRLVTNNLTLVLLIPYTLATVLGSLTGAKFSQRVEERFGITTDTKAKPSTRSFLAKKVLLVFLGSLAIWFAYSANDIWVSLKIAGFLFLNESLFSLLRRSRNSDNVIYHIVVSVSQSLTWYLLYRNLSLNGMAMTLFPAYCFGSICGSLFGQKLSEKIEAAIGASADAHLTSSKANFIPWNAVAILLVLLAVFTDRTQGNAIFVLGLAAIAAGQQVAFSVVSRSRQRSSVTYHAIASIFSNGVWFLTFHQIHTQQWSLLLYIPYALGAAIGSITGVGISMGIERAIGARSDVSPKKVSA